MKNNPIEKQAQSIALAAEAPENRNVVAALLGVAVLSQSFLFGVAVSGTSFYGSENPFPDYFGPGRIISREFDAALTSIADNLVWSVTLASESVGESVMSFLGVEKQYPAVVKVPNISEAQYYPDLHYGLDADYTDPDYFADDWEGDWE